MRGGVEHFKVTSVFDPATGRHERVQVAVCGKCGRNHSIHDAGARAKPVSMMAEKFRQKGWRIASRPGGDLCPRCVGAKPALTPAQRRAAYCRIASVPRAAGEKPETMEEAAMPTAKAAGSSAETVSEAPRQPTREDRRRILEALDTHYLVAKGCYAKNFSDRSVAEKLDVPRAWVTEERDRAYGPAACEADSEHDERLAKLEAQAKTMEANGLALAEAGESLRREVAAIRTKLAARGAV